MNILNVAGYHYKKLLVDALTLW